MKYNVFFTDALARLREERGIACLPILSGWLGASREPSAFPGRAPHVVVWCSNDYLGMGQHPKVIGCHGRDRDRMGTRRRRTRNIAGTNHPLVEARARAR